MDGVQDAVAPEQVAQLERARRPLLADHPYVLELRYTVLRPVIEELRDDPVKTLVVVPVGLGDIIVDAPEGHRLEDGPRGRPVPHPTSSARLAVEEISPARVRKSVPLIPAIHWSARTSATSSPAPSRSRRRRRAASGNLSHTTR